MRFRDHQVNRYHLSESVIDITLEALHQPWVRRSTFSSVSFIFAASAVRFKDPRVTMLFLIILGSLSMCYSLDLSNYQCVGVDLWDLGALVFLCQHFRAQIPKRSIYHINSATKAQF